MHAHWVCAHVEYSVQAFELATGDYLFEPHSGEDYSRDEGEYLSLGDVTLSHFVSKNRNIEIFAVERVHQGITAEYCLSGLKGSIYIWC